MYKRIFCICYILFLLINVLNAKQISIEEFIQTAVKNDTALFRSYFLGSSKGLIG